MFRLFPVIILAGGLGTRLASVSKGIPKALLPVGRFVFLDILLSRIVRYGCSNIYLSICRQEELFSAFVESSKYKELVHLMIEPQQLGTGGAVKYVLDSASIKSSFFVINGDTLSDIDLVNMQNFSLRCDFSAIMGLSKVMNSGRYGAVVTRGHSVKAFREKKEVGAGWINNGHYIFNEKSFKYHNGTFSLEDSIIDTLIATNELGAFKVRDDHFIDMGVPQDYAALCDRY